MISYIILFMEAVPLYLENSMKHIHVLCDLNVDLVNVQPYGTYSYYCALKASIMNEKYSSF
jgi:hypothetical protein